jgi:hypothetical protein
VSRNLPAKNKIQAIHQAPVLDEITGRVVDAFIPDRRTVQRAELGHVHLVEFERQDEIAGCAYRFRRLARHAENEQSLGPQPGRMNLAHRVAHRIQRHPGLVALHHGRIGRLDAQRNHQRTGLLELEQHFVRRMPGPNRAVELHAQRLVDEQLAEIHDPLFFGGEQIVIHVDVPDTELVAQILHVVVDVLRRIGLVQALEYRAIAEGTGIGATARGDHRRAMLLS